MTHRSPLPETLVPGAYRVGELRRAGLSRSRVDALDMPRAAHGIVAFRDRPAGGAREAFLRRCAHVRPALAAGQFFSRRTAAEVLGLPVPRPPGGLLEVGSIHPLRAPRRPEILGHRVQPGRLIAGVCRGLPVPSPEDTWCMLAAVLDPTALVIAGDALLTPQLHRSGDGRRRKPPRATLDSLREAIQRHRGTAGSGLRAATVGRLRWPVDSPAETRMRLSIVEAGIPEPRVACPVFVPGHVLHADLGYPDLRIAIEHDGIYHFRGGEEQARFDVERWELMQDAGWIVLRTTARDLRNPRAFIARLIRAIAKRTRELGLA